MEMNELPLSQVPSFSENGTRVAGSYVRFGRADVV